MKRRREREERKAAGLDSSSDSDESSSELSEKKPESVEEEKTEMDMNATKVRAKLIWTSFGICINLLPYLRTDEQIDLQNLNRFAYDILVSRVQTIIPLPSYLLFADQMLYFTYPSIQKRMFHARLNGTEIEKDEKWQQVYNWHFKFQWATTIQANDSLFSYGVEGEKSWTKYSKIGSGREVVEHLNLPPACRD